MSEPKKAKEKITQIRMQTLNIEEIEIKLVGVSSLIFHNWDAKTIKILEDKHAQKAKAQKTARDPDAEFKASLYPMPDGKGFGFPANAFKRACLFVAQKEDGMAKTMVKGAFHIMGDLVKIEGKITPRQDMVRVGMGSADIRYRGECRDWSCTLLVRFNASKISPEQLINLINLSGFGSGVGEWRPSAPKSPGTFGMFRVKKGE